jgi:CRP-like cAMP-binding protein
MPTHSAAKVSDTEVIPLDGNRLLSGLPVGELNMLSRSVERVRPRVRQLLLEQSGPMPYAYFPQGGAFSLLSQMGDGVVLDTMTVGSEGMIGLAAVLGAAASPTRAICTVSGWTLRIPVSALIEASPRNGALFDRFVRYAELQLAALSRSVACARLHSAQQRYARWVLCTQDRVGQDEFPITQDFLAQMLGVTRPTISLVAKELQTMRLIHYGRGRLTVDDRPGLQALSCECYDAIRIAYEGALGVKRAIA